MKRIMISCVAVAAFAAPAFAGGATYELKAGDGNYTGTQVDPLTGNPVAYFSSDATGNGGNISGNGSAWNNIVSDPSHGARGAAIQDLLTTVGKGSQK